jgi:hypothetical protein
MYNFVLYVSPEMKTHMLVTLNVCSSHSFQFHFLLCVLGHYSYENMCDSVFG